MNTPPNRRTVLCAMAAGALMPAFASRVWAATVGGTIAPPAEPMVFTRSLRRELAGGHAISALRQFEVRFLSVPGGHRVDGRQIGASVEAPPSLEAYARLERERQEQGLFPLLLDDSGLIQAGPDAERSPSVEQALDIALEQVTAALSSDADRSEARNFILGLQQAAGTISSAPPIDLFVPPDALQRASRRLILPDGASGELSTEYSGRRSPATGLLEEARRVIATELAGTRRETIESWTLHNS